MLESTKETCQNPNHALFFKSNGYRNCEKRRFPLIDVNVIVDEDKGTVQKKTWCSYCLTADTLVCGLYNELCSCGHHIYYHDLELGEKQQGCKEDRRFNICEGSGARCIGLDPNLNEEVKYGKYCRCKNFKPTKVRLPERKSDSNSIPT